MAASLARLDLRVTSESWRFEPLQIPGFLILLLQQQRLTAATSMKFQHVWRFPWAFHWRGVPTACGGCSDVQMTDAAGATGSASNYAHGAGGPDGRAGSVVSGDSGSGGAWSSKFNGRDMRGGNAHTGYPDEAEDQEAERSPLEGAGPSPIRQA